MKQCRYCFRQMPINSWRAERTRGEITGYCCRSELGCFNRILAQRNVFLRIGNKMSNACYNLWHKAESPLSACDKETLANLQAEWDSEKRGYIK